MKLVGPWRHRESRDRNSCQFSEGTLRGRDQGRFEAEIEVEFEYLDRVGCSL